MRKIVFAMLALLVPVLFFGQSAFDKFDGRDGVRTIVVNKKMFELIGNVKMDTNDEEAQKYLTLVKKLNNLKVFTTSDSKAITDMKSSVNVYLKKYPLEELMRVNEGNKVIKIYVKTGSSPTQVKELLMFMEGGKDDTVLMTLTGNFDLNELSVLTDKMNLPGGIELKNASKKNK